MAEVEVNADTGISFTMAGIRTLGMLYGAQDLVPQRKSMVAGNMTTVLRRIYGIAFSNKSVGTHNLIALDQGLDPSSGRDAIAIKAVVSSGISFPRSYIASFETKEDDAGQIIVRAKFPRLIVQTGHVCPAASMQVPALEGEGSRSALWTFMEVIGGVAVDHICTRQFSILNDEENLVE